MSIMFIKKAIPSVSEWHLAWPGTARQWMCGVAILIAAACRSDLSDEEKAFRARAETITVGSTLKESRLKLGGPSRILEAGQECKAAGGKTEWLYSTFKSANGETPLEAGPILFCANERQIIVAVFYIQS